MYSYIDLGDTLSMGPACMHERHLALSVASDSSSTRMFSPSLLFLHFP